MKITKILMTVVMAVFITSCQDGVKKNEQTVAPEDESDSFKVTVTAIAQKDDDFCLLYTEDKSIDFKEGLWQEVVGSNNEQVIEFLLPIDVFPTQLRLDLGKNPDQTDVVLKSIKFDYHGNVRELRGEEMAAFFRPDLSNCTFDAATGVVKAVVKDGKKQNPSLYPHEAIMAAELPKLAL